jgi:hypothetical protein
VPVSADIEGGIAYDTMNDAITAAGYDRGGSR